jgi:hypothetical protein
MDVTDIARKVQLTAPTDLVPYFGPLYYRYLNLRADWQHNNKLSINEQCPGDTPDHVLILVIDALRPDYEPDLQLEFSRAITPGTWTFPSVTSIQTGLYPHEHGSIAHNDPDDDDGLAIPKQFKGDLTLPNFMQELGYDTYLGSAFINPFLALQGWFQTHSVYGDASAVQVIGDYHSWRRGRHRTYSYLHFGDLHATIDPPSEYVNKYDIDTSLEGLGSLEKYSEEFERAPDNWREQRLRLYSAALDYLGDVLQDLLNDVRDDTFLIITGDHGEAMWEHPERDRQFGDSRPKYGVGHEGTPYDMIARVPVASHHPNRTVNLSSGGWPSIKDIPQTICSGLGLDDPPFGGVNWFDGIPSDRAAICEATGYGTERKAIYEKDQKIIRSETADITLGATVLEEAGERFETLSPNEKQRLVNQLPEHWDNIDSTTETSTTVENQLEAHGNK